MLYLEIPDNEFFDENKSEFIYVKAQTLKLEHSLISISKWESKWQKPFLYTKMTTQQTVDYIRCMTVGPVNDLNIYYGITDDHIKKVNNYINNPMSATTFNERFLKGRGRRSNEIVTSEIIYYWMVTFRIPIEFEKWHLNRLMNLIKICEIKSRPGKKMSQRDILKQNAELNQRRLAQTGSRG